MITKNTFNHVLEKIDKRLSACKAKSLSSDARYTLVQSTVPSIPSYMMQTVPLTHSTCSEIDKCCRQFLWGYQPTHKKLNLVSWDKVCQRKDDGGLDLRKAKIQNNAYMTKLG